MQATEAYWIHNFEVTFYSLVIHWSIPLLSYVFETLCGSNTNTRKPNSRQGQISSFGFLASVFRQIWWNWFVNRPIPQCILIFNWSIVFGTFPMCFAPETGSQSLSHESASIGLGFGVRMHIYGEKEDIHQCRMKNTDSRFEPNSVSSTCSHTKLP